MTPAEWGGRRWRRARGAGARCSLCSLLLRRRLPSLRQEEFFKKAINQQAAPGRRPAAGGVVGSDYDCGPRIDRQIPKLRIRAADIVHRMSKLNWQWTCCIVREIDKSLGKKCSQMATTTKDYLKLDVAAWDGVLW
ncbi:hypothetical protein EVAR_81069_1 [Eumeta japonica]|uniref:Uncharacterized protein n=1 Tax=Eumeta variegata TaxID=151549 RepID=A0A4C1T920_EUMVA|nr:hypothetical protein EVAR_81069_1 [Eumeta japonica]